LEEIVEQKWKHAHLFFQCVAAAPRPFYVEELAQFLAFDFEAGSTPTFMADWRPEDPAHIVLSMCSSLLVVVEPEGYSSPVVQFAHFSVKEYLTSTRLSKAKDTISRFHVSMTPAHTIVARACLGLLLHFDETVTEDSLKNFPLAEYAAEYWVAHAQIEDVVSKVQDGIKRLFDPSKSHLSIWVWICDPGYFSYNRPERSERPGQAGATPLHYAVCCGMHDVVKFLIIEYSQDVTARGFDSNTTPLHLASHRGHADIAQLLLKHGADGSAQNLRKWNPLHMASAFGHAEVARILLEQGADMEARGEEDASPLMLASLEYAEVTRVLLEHGADVKAQRGGNFTSLHDTRVEETARLLLEHGADANALTIDGLTPLHTMSVGGYAEPVRVLLEHGVDASARDDNNATPLHLASRGRTDSEDATFREEVARRRPDIVRLLLQYGSDVHARDNEGRTPFMIATSEEDHNVMQLLLEYGAEDHRQR
jgi:ankyrin repeat protein